MLQDGVRGNNYPHRKSWIKTKKKHSCKRCAETTKGGWRRFSVRDLSWVGPCPTCRFSFVWLAWSLNV